MVKKEERVKSSKGIPNISELEDMGEEQKGMLAYLSAPRTIINLAAKFSISFSGAWAKINMLVEQKYVIKKKTMSGKQLYVLNTFVVQNK